MIKLAQTRKGELWTTFDWNSIDDDGCIVDLGCLRWDWSMCWSKTFRVIGVDPFEPNEPDGFELFRGVIGSKDGYASMHKPNDNEYEGIVKSGYEDSDERIEMISWKSLCKKFNIDKVSILKINIEGSEYSFLESLDDEDFSKINQIVISFHDWLDPRYKEPTEKAIDLLQEKDFTVISTWFRHGWYVCVKNKFLNKDLHNRYWW